MNPTQYYKENKDGINSAIMEMASDLAVSHLENLFKLPFKALVEPDDPNNPDGGTHYKEQYQDEYNKYYEEAYNHIAGSLRFDISEDDGVLQN